MSTNADEMLSKIVECKQSLKAERDTMDDWLQSATIAKDMKQQIELRNVSSDEEWHSPQNSFINNSFMQRTYRRCIYSSEHAFNLRRTN